LTVAVFFASLSAALACFGAQLVSSRRHALDGARNLTTCELLDERIGALENSPRQAALGAATGAELTRRVEQAASRASIPPENLIRVDPQAGRRIEDTEYVEQPTFLEIRQATFEQLAVFLSEVTASAEALRISAIRLTAPRGGTSVAVDTAAPETWDAEITLTILVFAPLTRRTSE
jgi:hypothetical protein